MQTASLSHFVIFNPTLRPTNGQATTGDKDEDDDLREAAQILFYTSRQAGGVSRDKMLRQVGLAKGLMSFSDVVVKEDSKSWVIHGQRSRLVLYTPEPDFFIYVNISLARIDNETVPLTSQGMSDELLVDALARGYEDFALLHGPLHTHLPPSSSFSIILDKYFTRFAFQFESEYLTSAPSLSTWVRGYPRSSLSPDSVRPLRDEINADSHLLVIHQNGSVYSDDETQDPAVLRLLFKMVNPALPLAIDPTDDKVKVPSDGKQNLYFGLSGLGLGKGIDGVRKTSWAAVRGWTPGGRAASSTEPGASSSSSWGFGLGGLGSVGTVFGLAGTSAGDKASSDPSANHDSASVAATASATSTLTSATPSTSARPQSPSSFTTQTPPSSELQEAAQPDEELEWDKRPGWIRLGGEDVAYEKRDIFWVIRDNTLLSVISPPSTTPYPLPTTRTTLSFFSALSAASARETTTPSANPYIAQLGTSDVEKSGEWPVSIDQTLVELKARLQSDPSLTEVYAKTSHSNVVLAKTVEEGELYMLIGKNDASLTDAEHAVRGFARTHPAFCSSS